MTISRQSSLVSQNVPEFIRSEYPTFVAFLEAYYEYLDQSTISKNLSSAKDVDETLDLFIESFKRDFTSNIPELPNLNTREFLKQAKAFYAARGTEASYKFLFRAMYGKEISVYYPETSILKTSDGRWNQDVSCIMEVVTGDPFSCAGQRVSINSSQTSTIILAKRVKFIRNNYYEIFFDATGYIDVQPGYTITSNGFVGSVGYAVDKVVITKPGSGFRVGQIFEISDTNGTGAKIRVTRIDENGGILFAKPVTFGSGYTGATYYGRLFPLVNSAATNPIETQFDTTGGTSDSGVIFTYQYSNDYSSGYEGTLHSSFFSNGTVPTTGAVDDSFVANIEIRFSGLAKYPGYYSSSNGFLSSTMKLQDNFYYQIYSYVLKLDEQVKVYRDVVKALLHPAGMQLFGDYETTTIGDLSLTLDVLDKLLRLDFTDNVFMDDVSIEFSTIKTLVDSFTASDAKYISMSKGFADSFTLTDSGSIGLTTPGNYDSYPSESYFDPAGFYTVSITTTPVTW